jgi:hypothetical protein
MEKLQIKQYVGEWLSLVEHLVRDQGVGGSNPLSPTNNFNALQTSNQLKDRPSGFGPGALMSGDVSFLGSSLNNGCSDSYKIVYSQKR